MAKCCQHMFDLLVYMIREKVDCYAEGDLGELPLTFRCVRCNLESPERDVHESEIKRSCNEVHPGQDVHHPEGH